MHTTILVEEGSVKQRGLERTPGGVAAVIMTGTRLDVRRRNGISFHSSSTSPSDQTTLVP
jgi:hypothetical protein